MRNREEELNRLNKERIQIVEKGVTKIEKLLTKGSFQNLKLAKLGRYQLLDPNVPTLNLIL